MSFKFWQKKTFLKKIKGNAEINFTIQVLWYFILDLWMLHAEQLDQESMFGLYHHSPYLWF